MKFLLLLACLSVQAAELTLSAPLAIDSITHSSARACWSTTGAVNAGKQLAFDTTANFNANHSLAFKTIGYSTPFFPTLCQGLSGLTAGTAYTVCAVLTDGSGNTTNCTNTGNANSRATFTTSALPNPHPALPVAPTTFDTSYPAAINTTLTIANDCSDRTSKLTTAYGAGNNNLTVKVVYPSLATQTSANCNLPLDLSGFTKSGTGTVIIASSDEATGPAVGVRTSPSNKNKSWMLCTSTYAAALSPTGSTRFVDLYLEPCDSVASSGQGDPLAISYLTRFDYGGTGLQNIVWDRVNFDGRGYPYRVQFAMYGYGDNIGVINSYFNHLEIWQAWVDTTNIVASGSTITSSVAFNAGHGDTTNNIGTFTVTQASGTGTGILSLRAAGAIEWRYSNGSASCASPCTAVLDATLTLPSDARPLAGYFDTRTVSYTAGVFTAKTFYSRGPLSDIDITSNSFPSGSVVTSEWASFGIVSDACGNVNPTSKVWMITNNYLGATGMGVFPQAACVQNGVGYGIDTSDWTITGNDFQSNSNCLVAFGTISGSSSPFVCVRRHHFETKNGYRFNISHNTMKDGFVSIAGNGGYAVDMKPDFTQSGQTPVSFVKDIYVGYNTITNEAACFYVAGQYNNGAAANDLPIMARIEYEQNICQANAYNRAQYFAGVDQTTLTNGGMTLWVEEQIEDLIFQHNTIYQPTGAIASVAEFSDRWSEGFSMLNNIVYVSSPFQPYRGIQSILTNDPGWNVNSTPSYGTASGSDGTTALNNGILPNGTNGFPTATATWDVRGNLFIAGCALAANSQCVDATTTASLVGDLSGQYPSAAGANNNHWITTASPTDNFGARQNLVGWINRANVPSGLYLTTSSPYRNAGTDGLDIGVVSAQLNAPLLSGNVTISGTAVIQ